MKPQYWYEFADTEKQAQAIVDRENARHPRRRKNRPSYTPWKSTSHTDPARFIVWYYI